MSSAFFRIQASFLYLIRMKRNFFFYKTFRLSFSRRRLILTRTEYGLYLVISLSIVSNRPGKTLDCLCPKCQWWNHDNKEQKIDQTPYPSDSAPFQFLAVWLYQITVKWSHGRKKLENSNNKILEKYNSQGTLKNVPQVDAINGKFNLM